MNISELSLKRPVMATVLNLAIILFGVVGYTFLAVRDYPSLPENGQWEFKHYSNNLNSKCTI